MSRGCLTRQAARVSSRRLSAWIAILPNSVPVTFKHKRLAESLRQPLPNEAHQMSNARLPSAKPTTAFPGNGNARLPLEERGDGPQPAPLRRITKLLYGHSGAPFHLHRARFHPATPSGEPGFLLARDAHNRRHALAVMSEGDIVATAVRSFVDENPQGWSGLVSSLHKKLNHRLSPEERRLSEWPGNPRWFSERPRRAAPTLRAMGINVRERRTAQGMNVSIEKLASRATPAAQPSTEANFDGANVAGAASTPIFEARAQPQATGPSPAMGHEGSSNRDEEEDSSRRLAGRGMNLSIGKIASLDTLAAQSSTDRDDASVASAASTAVYGARLPISSAGSRADGPEDEVDWEAFYEARRTTRSPSGTWRSTPTRSSTRCSMSSTTWPPTATRTDTNAKPSDAAVTRRNAKQPCEASRSEAASCVTERTSRAPRKPSPPWQPTRQSSARGAQRTPQDAPGSTQQSSSRSSAERRSPR